MLSECGLSNLNWVEMAPQVPCSDVVEPGEGYGRAAVEGGGGDTNLAGGRVVGSARGHGLWHDGDLLPGKQTACVSATPSPDSPLHEGKAIQAVEHC